MLPENEKTLNYANWRYTCGIEIAIPRNVAFLPLFGAEAKYAPFLARYVGHFLALKEDRGLIFTNG